MMLMKEEIMLNRSVLDIMEWECRSQDNVSVLYNNFFPMMVNKKMLIAVTENLGNFDKREYITFRPTINGRHVQILIDFMYMNDDDVIDAIVTVKNDNGPYTAIIRDQDGEEVLSTTGVTETESKFKLFYSFYLEEDCSKELAIIKANEDKNRVMINARKEKEQSQKSAKKSIKKK